MTGAAEEAFQARMAEPATKGELLDVVEQLSLMQLNLALVGVALAEGEPNMVRTAIDRMLDPERNRINRLLRQLAGSKPDAS